MATNPMQKKARNSFLAGMLVMLLIASIIIGILGYLIIQMKQKENADKANSRTVCILNKDIEAGTEITSADIIWEEEQSKKVLPKVLSAHAPSNSIKSLSSEQLAKISLKKGTILSEDMLYLSGEETTNDIRLQEYNMVILPTYLEKNQYVDIRLTLPTGQDYIVVSKKCVQDTNEDTLWIKMSELEILTMNNAIVEAYIMKGSKLYATTYTEPGMQENAIPTYTVSKEVLELVKVDPNITETAKNELYNRIMTGASQRNDAINNALNSYIDQRQQNIETKLENEITRAKEARKNYLDALNGAQ